MPYEIMNAVLMLHPVSAVVYLIYLAVFGALLIELRYRIGAFWDGLV